MSDPRALSRLERALRAAEAERHAPPGWEERVVAATRAARRRRAWLLAPALLTGVTLAVLALRWSAATPAVAPLALLVVVESGPSTARAQAVQVGDVVTATVRGGRHRALRIYRADDQLVLACPGGAGCSAHADQLTARLALDSMGHYAILALAAAAPLPAPRGAVDDDVAAASRSGAIFELRELRAR